MTKKLLLLFFIVALLISSLSAFEVDVTKDSQEILSQSSYFVDSKGLSFEQIKTHALFEKNSLENINLGFDQKSSLWVKLQINNGSSQTIIRVIEVDNPLLESVTLYDSESVEEQDIWGKNSSHRTLNRNFEVELAPHSSKILYLQVKNSTTALRLGLYMKSKELFLDEEQTQQAKIFLFIGILSMLLIYSTVLYLYTKEKSYIYYSFYLLMLLAQQATYLGISQVYLPSIVVQYDYAAVVLKVNMLYIAAAIFAKSFLQTSLYPLLDKIYNTIILLALIEIPLFGFSSFYYPEVAILTGFFFVIFNMFVGAYVYLHGYTQARFFVIGWSFLVVGFSMMILDGLGLITVMYKVPNLIMYLTAFEAVLLFLAFVDRYSILKEEKENADTLLVREYENRQAVIEQKIQEQTLTLSRAVEMKQTLLKELQHRTKNNLQLILSLVRIQSDTANDMLKEYSKNLENRINAIAKTHEVLYLKEDLEQINMDEYIDKLAHDLENMTQKDVIIKVQARQVYMSIKEASYIGLILNELITNSIKYTKLSNIFIEIEMQRKQNKYVLSYKDSGNCYDMTRSKKSGVGLKLVKTLVEGQLEGVIYVKKKNGCTHMIEFEL